MLVRYFTRPSRIEQLRSSTGGHLLEAFANELSQGRYQRVAARKHIRSAEHFLHWIARRNLSITGVEERYAQPFLDHLKRCRCHGHHPPLKPHRQKYSGSEAGTGRFFSCSHAWDYGPAMSFDFDSVMWIGRKV
jgi:hypothetical protein